MLFRSVEELSSMVDVSESVVKATMQSGRSVISLQQSFDDSKENSSTLEDRLEDTNADNNPFDRLAKKEMINIVKGVMCRLTAKEAAILRLRFGLFDDIEPEKYVVGVIVAIDKISFNVRIHPCINPPTFFLEVKLLKLIYGKNLTSYTPELDSLSITCDYTDEQGIHHGALLIIKRIELSALTVKT